MKRTARDPEAELDAAILEMADDARSTGAMSAATYERITTRQLAGTGAETHAPLSGDEIRRLRERANMSQVVFAHHLNLTPDYVSELERGLKAPAGPALVLLNVIRKHGIDMLVA